MNRKTLVVIAFFVLFFGGLATLSVVFGPPSNDRELRSKYARALWREATLKIDRENKIGGRNYRPPVPTRN